MAGGNAFLVGRSGLISFQRSLNTISHNISNVNTEGYSRQRVNLETRYPTPSGAGFIGNGVYPVETQRIFNEHAIRQVQLRTTSSNFFNEFRNFAEQVDNILADQDAGLSPAMLDFFDAVSIVADDPTSSAAREGLLSNAESLVDRVQTIDQWLSDLRDTTNDKISNVILQINALAQSIADLNQDILIGRGLGSGSEPNDLLDKRDQKLKELAELVSINISEQDDGMINVYIGSGQSLVLGSNAQELVAGPDPDDPMNYQVAYKDPYTGTNISVTDYLTGGQLGGVLEFRDEVLIPSMNHLGRLTLTLTMTFNTQHRIGMDANDNPGGDFFLPEPILTASQSFRNVPVSPAAITAQIVDVTQLTTDEYRLTYDGPNYTLVNMDTGQSTALVPGAGPPFTLAPPVDGLEYTVDVLPNAGDVFFMRPTRTSARLFEVAINDQNLIAASGLMRTNADINNLGSAVIGEASVSDPTDPNLLNPVLIEFRNLGVSPGPANEYRIDGGAWVPYAGNFTVTYNGWDVTVSGDAWDGDSFTVEHNIGGISDNRNALALGELQNTKFLNGGTTTYQDAYGQLVVLVGNNTQQAIINAEAQDALLAAAIEQRDAISGVNLDEEAANMLRFQQAYSAAAQVIAAADSLFQELLSAVRR